MTEHTIQSLVSIFTRNQTPLVWSLLVSVFGDLAQDEGLLLSSGTLGQIMQTIGIKPEATRVALHRLRKEGWLESERTGRTSNYFLTDTGRAETITATPRIYSRHAPANDAWIILSQAEPPKSSVVIANNIHITSYNPKLPHLYCQPISSDEILPDWMTERFCDAQFLKQTSDAATCFRQLKTALPPASDLSASEIAVLRVLVVHTWRRIVLRSPILPDFVFPPSWDGPACRELFHELLKRLPAPRLEDLKDSPSN